MALPLVLLVLALVIGAVLLVGREPDDARQRRRVGQVALALLALMALALLSRGILWALPVALVLGAALALAGMARKPAAPKSAGPDLGRAEALATLGLEPGASAGDIRAAHRRLIARLHPDQGGSAELAARINRARDILLKEKG